LAEIVPKTEDYPNIPLELLTTGSSVFVKLSQAIEINTFINWWYFTKGQIGKHIDFHQKPSMNTS
jgi:hypothetical protein